MKALSLKALMTAVVEAGAEEIIDSISTEQAMTICAVAKLKAKVDAISNDLIESAKNGTETSKEVIVDLLSDVDQDLLNLCKTMGVTKTEVGKATTHKITEANKAKMESLRPKDEKVKNDKQVDIEDDKDKK